jgi:hypothetical protein
MRFIWYYAINWCYNGLLTFSVWLNYINILIYTKIKNKRVFCVISCFLERYIYSVTLQIKINKEWVKRYFLKKKIYSVFSLRFFCYNLFDLWANIIKKRLSACILMAMSSKTSNDDEANKTICISQFMTIRCR